MELAIILAALLVFDVLAVRFGADSRDPDIRGLRTGESRSQI